MFGILNTKRQRIVAASILVTVGFLVTQLGYFFYYRYFAVAGLAVFAGLASLWALWGDLNKTRSMILVILPVMYTLGFGLFDYLFQIRWLTRIPATFLYGISFYCLLLTQNILNIAPFRLIPLYRAALTGSFLFTFFVAFLLFRVLLVWHLEFYGVGLIASLISFPLIMQMLWSVELKNLTSQVVIYTFILALLVGECGLALSFWPASSAIYNLWSILLSCILYILTGAVIDLYKERLSGKEVAGYAAIGGLVLLLTFITTPWVG